MWERFCAINKYIAYVARLIVLWRAGVWVKRMPKLHNISETIFRSHIPYCVPLATSQHRPFRPPGADDLTLTRRSDVCIVPVSSVYLLKLVPLHTLSLDKVPLHSAPGAHSWFRIAPIAQFADSAPWASWASSPPAVMKENWLIAIFTKM